MYNIYMNILLSKIIGAFTVVLAVGVFMYFNLKEEGIFQDDRIVPIAPTIISAPVPQNPPSLPGSGNVLLTGSFGGEHISLMLTPLGGRLEYDCAVGVIDEPIYLKDDGSFKVVGRHIFESGGPEQLGSPSPKQHKAHYEGRILDNVLTLTVTLSDSDQEIGIFTLRRDSKASLQKCL